MKKLLKSVIFDIQWTFSEPPNGFVEGIIAVLKYFFWHLIWKRFSPYHVIPYHGNSLLVDSSTDGAAHAYISPNFDYGIQTILKQFLHPDDVMIDVGSNIGTEALIAGKREIKVHCFEPTIDIFRLLQINVSLNKLENNLFLNNKAVSNYDGYTTFYINEKGRSGLNSIYKDDTFTKQSVKIPCITLDSYCLQQKISKIKLLKVDVEGAELLVFKGATNLLKNHKIDVIHWESNYETGESDRLETTELLKKYDYEQYGIDFKSGKLVLWNNHHDCVSIPKSLTKQIIQNLNFSY